jgi:hypothetical protein
MKLKIHDQNLQLVWDCLSTGGHSEVWLHGDGNVFPVYKFDPQNVQDQDHSQNHSKNYNNGHEQNGYRVKISKANMPKTVKDAEMMLMRAKQAEEHAKDSENKNINQRVNSIRVSDTDFRDDIYEPAGEIDYSAFARDKNNVQK